MRKRRHLRGFRPACPAIVALASNHPQPILLIHTLPERNTVILSFGRSQQSLAAHNRNAGPENIRPGAWKIDDLSVPIGGIHAVQHIQQPRPGQLAGSGFNALDELTN